MKKPLFLLFFLGLIFGNAQEKKSTAAENVHVISEKFEIPQLNTTRRIWIYLPPNYKKSTKKYPVMYLHDGQNLFDDKTSYAGEWQIDETLNRMTKDEKLATIVVGIDHGDEKRIEELSPFKNEKYGGGKGDLYLQFIVENLKPYIDENYRTKTSKKFTTLGGSSLGALISVYGAVKYPDVFGKVLAFSPAFWFNSKDLNDYISAQKINLKNQKYYFIQGKFEDEGMDLETQKVIDQLKLKKVKASQIYFKEDEKGKHNEFFWRRAFPEAFLWLNN